MAKITVQKTDVTILKINDTDYISLTDIAKYKTTDANAVIANWLRNRMTIEYLGLWEILYNPHFKPLEFEGLKLGLYKLSHIPKYSMVLRLRIQLPITAVGSSLLYFAMSVSEI